MFVLLASLTIGVYGQTIPSSIDWTDHDGKSYVTPVWNQGLGCGAGSYLSSADSISSAYAIKNGQNKLYVLSAQQLIDCTMSYGNYGCNGGYSGYDFNYTMHQGGLCMAKDYPYTDKTDKCHVTESCNNTLYDAISGFVTVESQNETALMEALMIGPVSIYIKAMSYTWSYYTGGIINSDSCNQGQPDHGVLLVGYGRNKTTGEKYWKVKNSYGSDWGENGYARICRDCDKGPDGECGILNGNFPAVYPVIA